MALVVLASAWLMPVKWAGLFEVPYLAPPSLAEVLRNAGLALRGHPNGYTRTAHGYLIFIFMAGSFISLGRALLKPILSGSHGAAGVLDRLTGRERFSFYFMIGSLIYSLTWLGLGVSGALNPYAAFAAGAVGWLPAVIGLVSNRSSLGGGMRARLASFYLRWKSLTFAEKILLALAGAVLLLLSSNAALYPTGPDTLASHGGLPNAYIQQGRVAVNPYHIYSYLTQNTEMLIMGALLLGSEFAAQMLVWSFLAVLLVLMWGFLERHAGSRIAVATAVVILAIPTVSRSAHEFKNDSSTTLFIVAHYLCLIEALRRTPEEREEAQKWFMLAGLTLGGAVGHKLLAAPVAFFSILMMAVDEGVRRRKNLPPRSYFTPLLAGLAVTVAPWFLRTFIYTGNPMYPFFEKMYPPRTPFSVNMTGLYFYDLLLGAVAPYPNIADSFVNPSNYRPTWGASLIFLALFAPSVFMRSARGFGLCWTAALLSYALLVYRSLVMRYHMAPLVFLIATMLALSWRDVLEHANRKVHLWVPLGVLALSALISNVWINAQPSLSLLLSGYLPGNRVETRRGVGNLYWMSRVVNTRSGEGESVLFAGVLDTYPFKRKIFATGPMNPQKMLAQLAERAPDSSALREDLVRSGIDHIIVSDSFFTKPELPAAQIKDEAMARIRDLLSRRMRVRYALPDRSLTWYTFTDAVEGDDIRFDARDAEAFPSGFIDEVKFLRATGKDAEAERLLEAALTAPMADVYKREVLRLRDDIKRLKEPSERSGPAEQRH